MGLFDAIKQWKAASAEKRMLRMEEQGLCPDCSGKGFYTFAPNEFNYNNIYECSGCEGSGMYADWVSTNQQI
ncbi:methionine aminopeptidase [Peribacillus saganii]|uniref:Methionine aminopeptidase n=1 Tax=Peribacillus saganii TaxID=2303992 RepID=A0A372LN36_9BACI|nr:methionine aminopeptidase [Peribacillus saganii]RFU68930.1 methionine aminopeptidase [Peribacillus saganii]